eukprot:9222538-Karenia_brevis.AAC.1
MHVPPGDMRHEEIEPDEGPMDDSWNNPADSDSDVLSLFAEDAQGDCEATDNDGTGADAEAEQNSD